MWLCWDVCLNWFVVNTLFGLRETLHPWVETLVRIVILVDYVVNLESLKSYLSFETISNSCFDSLIIMNDWFWTCNTLDHANLKWFTSKVFDWLQSLNELCTNDVWAMFSKFILDFCLRTDKVLSWGEFDKCQKVVKCCKELRHLFNLFSKKLMWNSYYYVYITFWLISTLIIGFLCKKMQLVQRNAKENEEKGVSNFEVVA